jgi:glycerate kinase
VRSVDHSSLRPLHVLIAPNAARGTATASDVAATLQELVTKALPNARVRTLPLADGGDGSAAVAATLMGGKLISTDVETAFGTRASATFAMWRDAAFVEMATASGLGKAPPPIPITHRSSTGAGELILASVAHGARRIEVGVGGSCTADLGAGALAALGVRFLDSSGHSLAPVPAELRRVRRVTLENATASLGACSVRLRLDVAVTPREGLRLFGPQKGMTADELDEIEFAWAALERALGCQRGDLIDAPGCGAGGGLPAGFRCVLNTPVSAGSSYFLRLARFSQHMSQTDIVVTAEGKFDSSSYRGKLPVAVARAAARAGVTTVVAAHVVEDDGEDLPADTLLTTFVDLPQALVQAASLAAARTRTW